MLDISRDIQSLSNFKRNTSSAIAGIQQGLADIESGETRPLAEFMQEMHHKHGISS